MNKLLASALVLTFALVSASAQGRKPIRVWPEERLAGPVHTVQIELAQIYLPVGSQDKIIRRPHQKYVYDRRGNEIERTDFKPDGSIESRYVQIFDDNDRIIASEGYEPEADGKSLRLVSKSQTRYDERGNRVDDRGGLLGSPEVVVTASYDGAGHVIEESRVTDHGAYKEVQKHSYDTAGRLLRTKVERNGETELIEQSYDPAGHLLSYKYSNSYGHNDSESRYVYDTLGREVESSAEDAISTYKRLTSYDAKGRVSQRVTYFSYKQPGISSSEAPEPGAVKFRYNDNGQVVEEVSYFPFGKLRRRTETEYDEMGRTISISVSDSKNPPSKTTFEYDRWGNCVKKTSTSKDQFNKESLYVTYRVITYYEDK